MFLRAAKNKEWKLSRFLGWFNIIAGIALYIAKWLLQ
ncbi:CLC_0170 family protein [Paenibacillus sp. sgz302251]